MELERYQKEVARTFSGGARPGSHPQSFATLCRRLRALASASCTAEFTKKWVFCENLRTLHEGDPLLVAEKEDRRRSDDAIEEMARRCGDERGESATFQALAHALVGLGGEWHGLLHAVTFETREQVIEEIGDLLFYPTAICNVLGIGLDEVLRANVAKIRARHPDRFSAEAAANRKTTVESQAMEGQHVTW
jgi:NTP pyrophosphatase (non-canonical NTP hydrolase)